MLPGDSDVGIAICARLRQRTRANTGGFLAQFVLRSGPVMRAWVRIASLAWLLLLAVGACSTEGGPLPLNPQPEEPGATGQQPSGTNAPTGLNDPAPGAGVTPPETPAGDARGADAGADLSPPPVVVPELADGAAAPAPMDAGADAAADR